MYYFMTFYPDEERKIEKIVLKFFFFMHHSLFLIQVNFFPKFCGKVQAFYFYILFFPSHLKKEILIRKVLLWVFFHEKTSSQNNFLQEKFHCIENNYYIFLLPEGAFLETKRPNQSEFLCKGPYISHSDVRYTKKCENFVKPLFAKKICKKKFNLMR